MASFIKKHLHKHMSDEGYVHSSYSNKHYIVESHVLNKKLALFHNDLIVSFKSWSANVVEIGINKKVDNIHNISHFDNFKNIDF